MGVDVDLDGALVRGSGLLATSRPGAGVSKAHEALSIVGIGLGCSDVEADGLLDFASLPGQVTQADERQRMLGQQLNGLLSMPILSVFIVGLVFTNVAPAAAGIALLSGVALYSTFTFVWTPLHYIHLMAITLAFCLATALLTNRVVFGRSAQLTDPRNLFA